MSVSSTHAPFLRRWLIWALLGLWLWSGCEPVWFPPPDRASERFVKLIGTEGRDALADLKALPDGYLLLATTETAGAGSGSDIMLIQTDRSGNQIGPTRTFGASNASEEAAFLTPVGNGWAVGANRTTNDGRQVGWVVWLDESLNELADIELRGASDESFALAQATGTEDGIYWVGSTTAVDPLKNSDEDTLATGDTHDLWVGRLDLTPGGPLPQWERIYGFKGVDEGVAIGREPGSGRLWLIGNTQFPANSTESRLLMVWLRQDGYLLDQQVFTADEERAVDLAYDASRSRWQVLSYEPGGVGHLRQFGQSFAMQNSREIGLLSQRVPTDLTVSGDSLLITGTTPDQDVFAMSLDANGTNPSSLLFLGNPGNASPDRGGFILPGSGATVLVGATLGWANGGSLILLAQQPLPTSLNP